jgi:hypothetical protein
MVRKKKRRYGPWSWTEEDIKLLKELYPFGKTGKIAERLGRPLTTVRQKAYDLGIKTKIYNFWTDKQIRLLKKYYTKLSIADMAKRFKRSKGSIRIKAAQIGLAKKQPHFIEKIKT